MYNACERKRFPQREFLHAEELFFQGDLSDAQREAEEGYRFYSARNLQWAWKFRLLDARTLNWRGMNKDVISLLDSPVPPILANSDLDIQEQQLRGLSYVRLHRFDEAKQELNQAATRCVVLGCRVSGEILTAQGALEIEQGNYPHAREFFERSLLTARAQNDSFLEAMALLNLSHVSLLQEHFDEAIDWSRAAFSKANKIRAKLIEETALGNLGWAYYGTGDSARSLGYFQDAEKRAKELSSLGQEARWLTTTGYVYLDNAQFEAAVNSYHQALDIARELDSKEDIFNALLSLAFATAQNNQLDLAKQYSQDALDLANKGKNQLDQLYAMLAVGQVAARTGDPAKAEHTFVQIADVPNVRLSLRWEAQHELANLYEDEHRSPEADRTYRSALSTFETARCQLEHEDSKLPFVTNAAQLYRDYIHFLIEQGKTDEAFRTADYSRAQTLAEVLGALPNRCSFHPPALNAQQIARQLHSALLFYWLGPKHSYLWAVTGERTHLFPLPPAGEIDALVKRYKQDVIEGRDVLGNEDSVGSKLYDALVAPAERVIDRTARVIILPDGTLNNLNFETLLVSKPKPHFWIEDVTISDASSLRLLAASRRESASTKKKLLLIGDPVAPNADYPELAKAGTEMQDIEQHFAPAQEVVFSRAKATPEAYLESKPGQFAFLHFVAHGTASQLSPLDSAVVLSKSTAEENSFKLYARDVIREPLHANLVTISTCYGAGTRAYTGEGLVGLSWAFLRAGAHNVIGALWEANDNSTPILMNKLYDGLDKDESPAVALRAAKLSLLHRDDVFRKPVYWAPFQLYTGP